MTNSSEHVCDVFIIGSGAAGLSLALHLAPHCQIILASKGGLQEGATYYAQGGIAAAFNEMDSWQTHYQDTLIAGAGLCDPKIVQLIVQQAPEAIHWLVSQGMPFDRHDHSPSGAFHLTREGGHSHPRILHVADATGKSLSEALLAQVHLQPTITLLEHAQVITLHTQTTSRTLGKTSVSGALVWQASSQQLINISAKIVVLATGGGAGLYAHNTHGGRSQGDGIALAWQAGCRVANLEFTQFHPTTLNHAQEPNLLLTEALRGEGAYLRRPDGSRFMLEVDPRAELAPRDIIARAMHQEMQHLQTSCLYLDISHQPAALIHQHFPTLYQRLYTLGLDLTQQPIPVAPAAHYTCGGVMVDQSGQTDITGLYAIGEVSYTGLHGANRLASNALLECIVYARLAANAIHQQLSSLSYVKPPVITVYPTIDAQPLTTDWMQKQQTIQQILWKQVGLIRSQSGLLQALAQIKMLQTELAKAISSASLAINLVSLHQQCQVALLIIHCALQRQESRGGHYLLEHPQTIPALANPSILSPSHFTDN